MLFISIYCILLKTKFIYIYLYIHICIFYLCILTLILYVVIFIMHFTRPKILLILSMQCFLHYCSVHAPPRVVSIMRLHWGNSAWENRVIVWYLHWENMHYLKCLLHRGHHIASSIESIFRKPKRKHKQNKASKNLSTLFGRQRFLRVFTYLIL